MKNDHDKKKVEEKKLPMIRSKGKAEVVKWSKATSKTREVHEKWITTMSKREKWS